MVYSSRVRKGRISFSLLLPMLELVLWAVLVPSQASFVYVRLIRMSRGSQYLTLKTGQFTVQIRRQNLLSWVVTETGMREWEPITAVNMPGTLGEMLISLPTTWPNSWHPRAVPLFAFRSWVFPFLALPAWWFAGCGFDALFGWRRPRWWTLLIGTLLCCAFLTMVLTFLFAMTPEDRRGTGWIVLGFGLWTLLFAAFPTAWLRRLLKSEPSLALGGSDQR